ncbi:MAG: glycosyltransferase family 1 protein [Lachnospiraceae bacterium]|nr:glycosyltransferase family 1 protein [Lachnospiraceae bacterium]
MSEPIRVLNVVGRMGLGGIETLIMNIYRNIDRDKVQFDFLIHKGLGGAYEEEIRSLGGKLYEMPVLRDGATGEKLKTYYWKVFQYRSALKHFFASHPEYHVIHGHMTNTAAIYMPIAKKYGNVKCCIAHSHLTQARPGLTGVVTDLLHRQIPRVATDFFACSEMAAKWIYPEKILKSGKVKIIKNGVDPQKFYFDGEKRERIREQLGVSNKIVIGNVARFKKEKNHEFQIDVFNELFKSNNKYVLLLIGDGELRPIIQDKVDRLGLNDSVIFLGLRNDVPDLMLAMDLFFLPSLYEGLPVVGVEAQASGLPVITSTGVTKEVDITQNVTFLDLSEKADVWAREIDQVIRNFERKDMSEYIRSNGYDITQTTEWLEKFYLDKHNC